MTAEIPNSQMAEILEKLIGKFDRFLKSIKAIYAFGKITRPDFSWWSDEVNLLIVIDADEQVAEIKDTYEKALEKLEADYGMPGAAISRSSTAHLVMSKATLLKATSWTEQRIRVEWIDEVIASGVLLVGKDLRAKIPQPDPEEVARSKQELSLPFSFDVLRTQCHNDRKISAFFKALAYGSADKPIERFEPTGFDEETEYIRRPSLEDILRTEIDKYLKKNAVAHIYFKGVERFEGKTWLLRFTLERCRERGLPVRFWFETPWRKMDENTQLETIKSQISFLKSRKWAVFLIDNAHHIVNLDEMLKLIQDSGFVAIMAGVAGNLAIRKRENLRVVSLAQYEFPRPTLIKNLRNKFRTAGILFPKSPVLAAIVRATGNPFKAAAMAGGMMLEAVTQQGGLTEPPVLSPYVDAWCRRANSREFFTWCSYVANPDFTFL